MFLFCISWEADIESQMLHCHWQFGTTCMTMDIIDKFFYMSHERQMKLIFQIDIDYPQGYYQVIMAQLEMWPVAL